MWWIQCEDKLYIIARTWMTQKIILQLFTNFQYGYTGRISNYSLRKWTYIPMSLFKNMYFSIWSVNLIKNNSRYITWNLTTNNLFMFIPLPLVQSPLSLSPNSETFESIFEPHYVVNKMWGWFIHNCSNVNDTKNNPPIIYQFVFHYYVQLLSNSEINRNCVVIVFLLTHKE